MSFLLCPPPLSRLKIPMDRQTVPYKDIWQTLFKKTEMRFLSSIRKNSFEEREFLKILFSNSKLLIGIVSLATWFCTRLENATTVDFFSSKQTLFLIKQKIIQSNNAIKTWMIQFSFNLPFHNLACKQYKIIIFNLDKSCKVKTVIFVLCAFCW